MALILGLDTLCYHMRLERGRISLEAVLQDAVDVGARCVQVNLHHVREYDDASLRDLSRRARDLDLQVLASGDFLGQARHGDMPAVGVARVRAWLDRAVLLESPILRVVSGFYRAELAGTPSLIQQEQRYVTDVLRTAAEIGRSVGITLLLENHSDFSVGEYRAMMDEIDDEGVGVFLDLINPVSALEDPVEVVRQLAPLARAGHVKDYVFQSIPTDDGYHRRGFDVLYRYPGEGVADLAGLTAALLKGVGDRPFFLTVEGLDNHADRADQRERLAASLRVLRGLVGAESNAITSGAVEGIGRG
jgi:sugar phosphate isomerase/epimerase